MRLGQWEILADAGAMSPRPAVAPSPSVGLPPDCGRRSSQGGRRELTGPAPVRAFRSNPPDFPGSGSSTRRVAARERQASSPVGRLRPGGVLPTPLPPEAGPASRACRRRDLHLRHAGPCSTWAPDEAFVDTRRLRDTAAGNHPLHGLSGDLGHPVEVGVIVQNTQPGRFGDCGDQQVRDRHAAVLTRAGQSRLDLDGSLDAGLAYRSPRQGSAVRQDGQIVLGASSAEQQLQIERSPRWRAPRRQTTAPAGPRPTEDAPEPTPTCPPGIGPPLDSATATLRP